MEQGITHVKALGFIMGKKDGAIVGLTSFVIFVLVQSSSWEH
ncbi:MAG: hypothetical protein ACTSXH_10895 [Promethearchaeota archaeon]